MKQKKKKKRNTITTACEKQKKIRKNYEKINRISFPTQKLDQNGKQI